VANENLRVIGDVPKTLMKLVQDNSDKIAEIEQDFGFVDDRSYYPSGRYQKGYWLYLKEGWYWPGMGWHLIHESSIHEIRRCIAEILPCDEHCHTCEYGS
jgi:hypothetical protein